MSLQFEQMDSVKVILLTFLLTFLLGYSWAQKSYTISLGEVSIVPEPNLSTFNTKESIWRTHIFQGRLYLLLQFHEIPDQATHAKLQRSDIQLLDYLPEHTYLASCPASISEELLTLYDVRAILPVQADWKLSTELARDSYPNTVIKNGELEILILLQKDIDKSKVLSELGQYGKVIMPRIAIQTPQTVYFQIEAKPEKLSQLAALPFIQYIQLKESAPFPLSNNARATQRANVIMNTGVGGLGLTGNNVVIGVGDGGTIDQHIDLDNRILNAYNIDENAHGAKVTGIIAGEGILEPTMRGFAPQSDVVAEVFTNVLNSTGTYYNSLGMVLTNNSYGTSMTPFCSNAGDYNGSSKAMDQIANNYTYVLHCLAAGNDGDVNCSPYPTSFRTVFQGLQSSKNALTVGSVDAYDVIADDSSRGPTQDGRIKPDLVGIGVDILSPQLNNQYSQGSGTSLSTPSVTGTFALLWEHYRNLNGSEPTAALMKAIACNTADDLGNPGPDFTHGYGRINAKRAADAITNQTYYENTITHNSTQTSVINVPANTAQVRVLVYWQDRDANPTATQSLVHDLDLNLDAPDGTNYRPWVLDITPANVNNNAIRALDKANNIEQVTIDSPMAGNYTVNVKGVSVAYGSQKYTVVYEIIPEYVQLTYPIGGEIFSPGEEMLITWDAAAYNTETFTIEYSFNSGAYWIPINTNVPADARKYSFITPNIISATTLVRITRNNSALSSTSNSVFSILARPNNFDVAPDCNGTINMSWSATSGISNYRIYEYQMGTWVEIGTTSSTSFSIGGRTSGQLYCYTVKSDYGSNYLSESAFGQCVNAYSSPIVTTMPYSEDFEASDGGWFTAGKNTDWEWGVPAGSIINSAAGGTKAWVTNLDGNYMNSSEAFLYSPCFDLSSLSSPSLSFSMIYSIENNAMSPGNFFDLAQVQYSLDGKYWVRLGENGSGTNWYSNAAGLHHWDGEQLTWTNVNYDIPSNSSRVQFRILLDADQFGSEEGVGIDKICIRESSAACEVPRLGLKTILGGVHNSGTNLMDDNLRQNNLVPMTEPYTALGYMHVGNGGGETTTSSVLAQTGNDAIIDWIIIEIRDPNTITTVVATRAALLQADGDIVEIDGNSAVAFPGLSAGNYHVAIRHRNHLGTMTAAPIFIGS